MSLPRFFERMTNTNNHKEVNMKKKMSMRSIRTNATKKGFSVTLNSKGSIIKPFGCPICKKNTAAKFVKGSISIIACTCGYRKKGRS